MPQSQSSGLFNTTQPNIFINGNFDIVQGSAGTIVAGTALPTASLGYAPMQTGWFNYAIGGNPTVAQVAGSGTTSNRLQVTGAASITAIGVGQRIESINAAQLAGQQAALSVDLANSLGLTVTWTAFHPSATADTFGTIASPTKTQIATGTFAVTSTLTRFSASFACPENIRRGVEIIFTVGAQTSGTWTIGNAKVEVGATATAFVIGVDERALCDRYCQVHNQPKAVGVVSSTGLGRIGFNFRRPMRSPLPVCIGTGDIGLFDGNTTSLVTFPGGIIQTFINSTSVEFDLTIPVASVSGRCMLTFITPGNTSVFTVSAQIP